MFYYFLVRDGLKRAWEVFKRLAGGRGLVLTKYGPVGSHGDPIHAHFYDFSTPILCLASQMSTRKKITCSIWTHQLFYFSQNDPLSLILWLLALPGPQHLRGWLSSLRETFQQNWVLLRSTISCSWEAQYLVAEKHNILLLRRKTCALLRAKTRALLKCKTKSIKNRSKSVKMEAWTGPWGSWGGTRQPFWPPGPPRR